MTTAIILTADLRGEVRGQRSSARLDLGMRVNHDAGWPTVIALATDSGGVLDQRTSARLDVALARECRHRVCVPLHPPACGATREPLTALMTRGTSGWTAAAPERLTGDVSRETFGWRAPSIRPTTGGTSSGAAEDFALGHAPVPRETFRTRRGIHAAEPPLQRMRDSRAVRPASTVARCAADKQARADGGQPPQRLRMINSSRSIPDAPVEPSPAFKTCGPDQPRYVR